MSAGFGLAVFAVVVAAGVAVELVEDVSGVVMLAKARYSHCKHPSVSSHIQHVYQLASAPW